MEFIQHLELGFLTALTFQNLFYCFAGVLVGTLIGVLPGIGPVAAIAMLIPLTYGLAPTTALIMLAGIYYGAQYGGSTTSILVNLPGESSSVVTCLDGYAMACQGRAGQALMIAAFGSFFAGCISTLVLAAFAPWLAELALEFGSIEYFSLMVLGLVSAIVLASGSIIKAIAMIIMGLIFGLFGTDINSGVMRFTFGIPELSDGIGFVVVAMGLFGFSEILLNLESKGKRELVTTRVESYWLTKTDLKESFPAVMRGTFLGSILGILPGGGGMLASFGSYSLEKKIAKNPKMFGKGAIQGVAGPEAANNAGAQTSFIPMLVLGIPPNAVMALMIGAMTIHDIQPGPQILNSNPALFWGLIASMWIGNLMLVILNMPLIGIWIKLLHIPYWLLYPAILMFSCIGIYSMNSKTFDVLIAVPFAFLGYIFAKLECEPAPFLLGFILGPMMEEHFRRALLLSRGDPSVFFTSALSFILLMLAFVLLVSVLVLPAIRRKRGDIFQEGERDLLEK